MKKLIILSLLGAVIILAGSCSDELLNKVPTGPTELTFFETETDIERTVFGIYAKMTDIYGFNSNNPRGYLWHLPGDDITSDNSHPYEIFAGVNSQTGINTGVYAAYYEIIRRAYTALEKINQWRALYETPGLEDAHRGEALFFIGYANYKLWTNYGQYAPLVDRRIQDADAVNFPSPEDNRMLDSAIAQFERASNLLPQSWPAEQAGRVTEGTALGMLGKALVTRASYFGNASDWTAAINAFSSITGYSLVDDYGANFDAFDENNDESLFEFQASSAPQNDNIWLSNDFNQAVGTMATYWGYYSGIPGWMSNVPFRPTEKLLATIGENDGRLLEIIDTTALTIEKYVKDGRNQNNDAGQGTSRNNVRILRYADILLLWAEALVESGGSPSQAIGLINQVRTRARNSGGTGFPTDYSTSETDVNTILEWIRNERFIELAGEEQHRWDDLRRWNAAGRINLANWGPEWTGGEEGFSTRSLVSDFDFDVPQNLWWPIPQDEVDRNLQITQNPEY